jgi:hypothetical protein
VAAFQSSPLSVEEWREFLRSYSSEFLKSRYLSDADSDGRARWLVSETQRKNVWLGYEPATEVAIRRAEKRLSARLPPSYRNFLLASNGWSSMAFSLDLLTVDQVRWFFEAEPELLAWWSEPGMEDFEPWTNLLKRCLLISSDDGRSGGYWLLHAEGGEDGSEWAAYEWWPGDGTDPERHDNFAALVETSYPAVEGTGCQLTVSHVCRRLSCDRYQRWSERTTWR